MFEHVVAASERTTAGRGNVPARRGGASKSAGRGTRARARALKWGTRQQWLSLCVRGLMWSRAVLACCLLLAAALLVSLLLRAWYVVHALLTLSLARSRLLVCSCSRGGGDEVVVAEMWRGFAGRWRRWWCARGGVAVWRCAVVAVVVALAVACVCVRRP